MDAITESVRAQYERFPYPDGPPMMRQASDARLLLSYVAQGRSGERPIQVLDAGCGRGVGLLGCASLQPDVDFLGVDLCRASLRAAKEECARRELGNVRFQEIDLMTLDGLEVPDGGFDVVLSSGVLHHLADPSEGLRRIASVLAPHGVVSMMVYGRNGRESLYRLVRAIDLLVPRDRPLEDRLAIGRELAGQVDSETLRAGPWQDQRTIGDTEFVDRYLNVNETSYDVPGMMGLLEAGGLSFLRWAEPADWAPEALLPPGPTRDRAMELDPVERWQLMDELFWRPRLEALLCKPENGPRPPMTEEGSVANQALCLSPELKLQFERRNLRNHQRTEALRIQVRGHEPITVPAGPIAETLMLLADQTAPFAVIELVKELAEIGVATKEALGAVDELLRIEAFYRPHAADI